MRNPLETEIVKVREQITEMETEAGMLREQVAYLRAENNGLRMIVRHQQELNETMMSVLGASRPAATKTAAAAEPS